MKYTGQNEASINAWKEKYDLPWMKPLTEAEFRAAARGEAMLTLTPNRKVPFSWYEDCKGKQVLGLAAGPRRSLHAVGVFGRTTDRRSACERAGRGFDSALQGRYDRAASVCG